MYAVDIVLDCDCMCKKNSYSLLSVTAVFCSNAHVGYAMLDMYHSFYFQ